MDAGPIYRRRGEAIIGVRSRQYGGVEGGYGPCAALEIHLVVSILCLSKGEFDGDLEVSSDGREGIHRRAVLVD